MPKLFERRDRSVNYVPHQINPTKVIEICEVNGVNPILHGVIRNRLINGTAFSSPGLIVSIGRFHGEPHHLKVLTTSDILNQGLCSEDKQLLKTLKARIPRRSIPSHLIGERVRDDRGIRAFEKILDEGNLDENAKKEVFNRVTIQPLKRRDIQLTFPEDDFLVEGYHDDLAMIFVSLKSGLRRFGRINGLRSGLSKDFCNTLISEVNKLK